MVVMTVIPESVNCEAPAAFGRKNLAHSTVVERDGNKEHMVWDWTGNCEGEIGA